MKTVEIGDFENQCRTLLTESEVSGEVIVVTNNGREMARVEPSVRPAFDPSRYRPGVSAGTAWIVGDLNEPLDVEWEALRG